MSVFTALILGGLYAVASFVQGLTGFAYGLILVPVLSLMFSAVGAVGMTAATAPFIIVYNYYLHRGHVEYRRITLLGVFSLIFVPVGVFALYNLPQQVIMGTLGAVVVVMTLFSVILEAGSRKAFGKRGVAYLFAAISGILGGAFTTPGPGMVAYLYTTDPSRMRAKANAQFYFVLITAGVVITHSFAGTFTQEALLRSLPFVPVILLFTWAGAALSGRLPVRVFRGVTDVFLIGMGSYVLLSSLR